MNNPILIACDNEDALLGRFFLSCHDRIREAAVQNGFDYQSLTSGLLAKEQINQRTANADEYVFAAFSHGSDDALLCNKTAYVEANDNVKNFYSSVFYTFACDTANGIGEEFRSAYVLGYFGYNKPAWVVPDYQDMFVECATKGLLSYLEGRTLKECADDMVAEYDKQISRAAIVSPVYALLLSNKQSLVTIINNEEKTIHD